MIRHVFKLIWNRKRSNALIVAEIFVAFLVLFAVVALGARTFELYRRPLGFDIARVWHVDLRHRTGPQEERQANIQQMLLAMQAMNEIASVASVSSTVVPYTGANTGRGFRHEERLVQTSIGEGSDGLGDVLNIKMLQGRWFTLEDEAMDRTPAVVNERLAHELFGAEDPIGKSFGGENGWRVVGVMLDYRKNGEFREKENFMIQRVPFAKLRGDFVVKIRPQVPRAFEEGLLKRLNQMSGGWIYQVTPLTDMRKTTFTLNLAPILIASTVSLFLMAMVGLGLLGVLWQMVTQRFEEIGLRRAQGATAKMVHRQFVGEVFALATLGIGLGILIVVQVPLLGLFKFLSGSVFVSSLLISVGGMYALATVCGWYPSRMATRVHPVEALHYE